MSEVITPGGYLRKRREAARLTLDQVVLAATGALPAASARATRLWRQIDAIERNVSEADQLLLTKILRPIFRFELEIYRQLLSDLPTPQLCRRCACSWTDPCVDRSGHACAWAEVDLCTSCVTAPPRPSAALPARQAA